MSLRSTHEGILKIGDKELPCAVLSDGTRVLTATAVFHSFDRPRKGNSSEGDKARIEMQSSSDPIVDKGIVIYPEEV